MVAYAMKNLLKDKLRFIISISGIAVAIALILLINGFASGLYKETAAYYFNQPVGIIVSETGAGMLSATSSIQNNLSQKIADLQGVKTVSPTIYTPYILRGNVNIPVLIIGSQPGKPGGAWKLAEGRNVLRSGEIVLDLSVARQKNKKIGDKIDIFGKDLEIVGLSRETSSYMSALVFVELGQLRKMTRNNNTTSYFLVKAQKDASIEKIKNSIQKELRLRANTPTELGNKEVDLVKELMSSPLNLISFISLVIGILVIGLSIYTSTLSKIKELGIIKAIGASSFFLYAVVIKQSLISTASASGLGIIFAYSIQEIVPIVAPQFLISIDLLSIQKALTAAFLMSILASVLPIVKIAKIDPVMVFKG